MVSLVRNLTPEEMVAAAKWQDEHNKTCPVQSVGKFTYDHDGGCRGIRVTLQCMCGAKKFLGNR